MARLAFPRRWWRDAVGYQIYVRSFADSDGDGIGDLGGVRQHLDHLGWIGVDALWLTPFYPSPGHDHGYDISDHCAVDAALGTLGDFDELVARAHDLGLRVLVDIVPNHTSNEHRWFQAALADSGDPRRDYYIWRDPAPDGGPPNNWVSNFGGPAWTLDPVSGQYYLHLFLPEQPDLNWRNPAVRAAFEEILRFWLARGVDGFRIDVAHMLLKDRELRDNPVAARVVREPGTVDDWNRFEHRHDLDQTGTPSLYRPWRALADEAHALLLGEVYLLDAARTARYVRHDDGLHLTFWFGPLVASWNASALRASLETIAQEGRGRVAWTAGNHDGSRPATRFGGGALGQRRALVLFTLLAGLPGMPFLYQGDEIGLQDAELSPQDAQDPIAVRAGEHAAGRDVARAPIPWRSGPGSGFTTASRAWLPLGDAPAGGTVEEQRADDGSWLWRYRELLHARRSLPELEDGAPQWIEQPADLLAYRRGPVLVAANLGEQPREPELPPGRWQVAFSSSRATGGPLDALEHDSAVVMVDRASIP